MCPQSVIKNTVERVTGEIKALLAAGDAADDAASTVSDVTRCAGCVVLKSRSLFSVVMCAGVHMLQGHEFD